MKHKRTIPWHWLTGALLVLIAVGSGCDNPFAPRLQADLSPVGSTLGDQHTVEGVFQRISYAYNYRDTLIYGDLLDSVFQFRYYNPERTSDVVYNRDEEMRVTSNLFSGVDQLGLQWNEIISQDGDQLQLDITRSYTLNIVLSGTIDVFRIDGRATLRLVRPTNNDTWHIRTWRDDSSF